MNRKIAIIAKQNKIFIPYVQLIKNKINSNYLTEEEKIVKTINTVATNLLEDFLLSQGITLNIFFNEARNSNNISTHFSSKENLIEKLWPCWEYINYSLTWSHTTQGYTFWRNLHNKWVKKVANLMMKDLMDSDVYKHIIETKVIE